MADKKDKNANPQDSAAAADEENGSRRQSGVVWNDSNMATDFANVVNVQSTREQVDLFFGTNQTWNVNDAAGVTVELTNRVILTPFAAKRLLAVLGNVLKEYESRHGALKLE